MTIKELQEKIQEELNKYTIQGNKDKKQELSKEPCNKTFALLENEIFKEIPNAGFTIKLENEFQDRYAYLYVKIVYPNNVSLYIAEFYEENNSEKEQHIIFKFITEDAEKNNEIKNAIPKYINKVIETRIESTTYEINKSKTMIQHLEKYKSLLLAIYSDTKTKNNGKGNKE